MTTSGTRLRVERREVVLLALSLTFVCLVAISVAGGPNTFFIAILLTAGLATVFLRWLFPGCPFFSLTFINLIAAYAAIFAFLVEEFFGPISAITSGFGFSIPIAFFLAGSWLQRDDIRAVVEKPLLRDPKTLNGAPVWLVPAALICIALFVLSRLNDALNPSFDLVLMMLAIGLIVLGISRGVAILLVDAGLLFEEFSERMIKLSVPAFAFLTFYSLLVFLFASFYSIISQSSSVEHFKVGSQAKVISFSEATHFSIATISTVGYGDIIPASNIARMVASIEVVFGVLLFLFGVSELLEYTREHRRESKKKDKKSG